VDRVTADEQEEEEGEEEEDREGALLSCSL